MERIHRGVKSGELHGGADGGGIGVAVPFAGHISDNGRPPLGATSFWLCLGCLLRQRHRLQLYFRNLRSTGDYVGKLMELNNIKSSDLTPTVRYFPSQFVFRYAFFWIFLDNLLVSLGQNPEIAVEAGRYAIWLIPALLAHPILQSLIRYLQCQSLVLPMFLSSSTAVLLHISLCWILTHKTSMGMTGAALSTGLALWFNVILLVIYMRYSSACEKSRAFIFKDVLSCVKEIFSYGVPSAAMIFLEWWSFELLIMLSGLLPDSMLETTVLSICMTITALHFFVP
ncbi:protein DETOXIFICATION 3-like [Hibiscus syriacus]|uniref:protein DETOXIFICATION 3-like n=1 Tax=Hibiscus syriacus TaxID=106335 RepID=UPI0019233B14|nr:protein DETOXIFICATION 3-like [Hibiscus syriacus]